MKRVMLFAIILALAFGGGVGCKCLSCCKGKGRCAGRSAETRTACTCKKKADCTCKEDERKADCACPTKKDCACKK